jgi:serine/threonine protein kinase/tetratricopeptide (TPR) repeat protein
MSPERRQEIERLYHAALERRESQRSSFLQEACAGDPALRREVESLLARNEATSATNSSALGSGGRAAAEQRVELPLAADDQLRPGTTVSHYRILEKLGGGGMGVVYKAEDTKLGRIVALKFLPQHLANDRAALERFEREARAASALNHPGICTIYEFGEQDGQFFLAMELIEGCSLRALGERGCSLELITDLTCQAAKALAAAHAAGIVHRDIKSENIMVRKDGYLKLVDFGIARFTGASVDSALLSTAATAPGTLLGTVQYMSPEQVRGEAVSSASDIFSLGIVLYELAAGRHPFTAASPTGVLAAIVSETPPGASQLNQAIPPALDGLFRQMLEKDARKRPTAVEIQAALSTTLASPTATHAVPAKPLRRPPLGREKERSALWRAYRDVASGRGALVCLSGEPGIGKTTLAEAFLEELATSAESCIVARGRCSERLAGSEAYLPLLEALDSLLHERSRATVIRTIKAIAGAWYAQVAPAAPDQSAGGSRGEIPRVSQEHLKRQLGALLRELSVTSPVVLFLDDLHWADGSTIDLLAYLGAKFDQLRLLVLVTYRPSDLRLAKHPFLPLKLDLEARGDCRDLALAFLGREEIQRYLSAEFPQASFPPTLASQLHSKTEGNPMFLVNLVSYLQDHQVIAEEHGRWTVRTSLESLALELPASVRSMIQRKMEMLSEDDQRLLSAASVQGYEFDSAVVASALGVDMAEVEERLAPLESVHGFVHSAGETNFPDRTISSHHRFVHILYQNAFYNLLAPTRRRKLSAAVAAALERHHGSETPRIAGELALLYQAARDFERSSQCFLQAARNAARISAHREAVKLARCGLEQLQLLPENSEGIRQELSLQMILGSSLSVLSGYGDPEVEPIYRRAEELARRNGDIQELVGVLRGLSFYHMIRGATPTARKLGDELLELAKQSADPGLLLLGYHNAGDFRLFSGEFATARDYLEKGLELYRAERDRSLPERFGAYDLAVGCRLFLAHALWYLGYPDQALACINEAVSQSRALKHPYSLAASLSHCAWIHVLRGEPGKAAECAEEDCQVSGEEGFLFHIGLAKAFRGWAYSEEGESQRATAEIQEGIQMYERTGAIVERAFMATLLADALAKTGRLDLALKANEGALSGIQKDLPYFCEAEVIRQRGELLRATGANIEQAESCFRQALEMARDQNAKSWELRAAISLARIYCEQGRKPEARYPLTEVYRWFSEGFETADFRTARTTLELLA